MVQVYDLELLQEKHRNFRVRVLWYDIVCFCIWFAVALITHFNVYTEPDDTLLEPIVMGAIIFLCSYATCFLLWVRNWRRERQCDDSVVIVYRSFAHYVVYLTLYVLYIGLVGLFVGLLFFIGVHIGLVVSRVRLTRKRRLFDEGSGCCGKECS